MIVLGTLLNDNGELFESCRISLCSGLFSEKRNAFIYGIIEDMHKNGMSKTYPADVLAYAEENNIAYGNVSRFSAYMCELSINYAFRWFKKYVKELVRFYLSDIKRNGTR